MHNWKVTNGDSLKSIKSLEWYARIYYIVYVSLVYLSQFLFLFLFLSPSPLLYWWNVQSFVFVNLLRDIFGNWFSSILNRCGVFVRFTRCTYYVYVSSLSSSSLLLSSSSSFDASVGGYILNVLSFWLEIKAMRNSSILWN